MGRLHRGDTADFKRKDQTVVIISTLDSGARGNTAINYNPLKYSIGAHFAILIISRWRNSDRNCVNANTLYTDTISLNLATY